MHSIWAVATNTIKQALRMKIAAVFIILLLVCLPALGLTATGDATLKGRLQTFVSYGLSLTSFLLCVLTIVVSVYSVTSDIKQKQIYTVITKPIRRFQLILGKLLGVILLDMGLLVLFSALIYATAVYLPRYVKADEAELTRVANEFFTARAALHPPEADVRREVALAYNKLKKSGQLQQIFSGLSAGADSKEGHEKIIAELTKQKQLEKRAAGVGRSLVWEFKLKSSKFRVHRSSTANHEQGTTNNERQSTNPSLFIRFKYNVSINPVDLQVRSRWVVGDLRQIGYGSASVPAKRRTPIYTFDREDLIRTFHEIKVPADAVAEDGFLAVEFINVPLNNTPVIFPPDGLEVLYKADTFSANFIRAVMLVLFRLIFLACLGTLTASFLSFGVAILFCIVVFSTALVSGFCLDSFRYVSAGLSGVYSYAIEPILALLPQFDRFSPTKFLVGGRLLSWSVLAKAAGGMVCIKALLLLLLAILIFTYKEIARVVI